MDWNGFILKKDEWRREKREITFQIDISNKLTFVNKKLEKNKII